MKRSSSTTRRFVTIFTVATTALLGAGCATTSPDPASMPNASPEVRYRCLQEAVAMYPDPSGLGAWSEGVPQHRARSRARNEAFVLCVQAAGQ